MPNTISSLTGLRGLGGLQKGLQVPVRASERVLGYPWLCPGGGGGRGRLSTGYHPP